MKNSAISIRQRLLNQARSTSIGFDTLLEQYAISRLFWKLAHSEYKDVFILKGAQLFRLWFTDSHRPTRDIDFLSYGDASPESLEAIFTAICSIPSDDGLIWDHLQVQQIREDNAYGGQRIKILVTLDGARIPLQIDVGFGDIITPNPITLEVDRFLQFEPASLLTYPPETVIA